MSFRHSRTGRGLQLVEFLDRNDEACELQQSSAIGNYENSFSLPGSSAVWLGLAGQDRMHLDREQARELAALLLGWADTGSFSSAHQHAPESAPVGKAAGKDGGGE